MLTIDKVDKKTDMYSAMSMHCSFCSGQNNYFCHSLPQ